MRAGHARPLTGGAEGETGAYRKVRGRDESLPYGVREWEIVGRPDLRPPRVCMGVRGGFGSSL